jgi:hypothetical protein
MTNRQENPQTNPRSAKLAKKPVPSGGKKDSKLANPLLKTKRLSDNQLLGINLLTRQIITEQIRILVAEDLQYLEVERERRKEAERTLKLEQEKQKKIEDFHSKISFYLNFYFIIAILMIRSQR